MWSPNLLCVSWLSNKNSQYGSLGLASIACLRSNSLSVRWKWMNLPKINVNDSKAEQRSEDFRHAGLREDLLAVIQGRRYEDTRRKRPGWVERRGGGVSVRQRQIRKLCPISAMAWLPCLLSQVHYCSRTVTVGHAFHIVGLQWLPLIPVPHDQSCVSFSFTLRLL